MMMKRWFQAALALALITLAGCPEKKSDLIVSQAELRERVQQYHECFTWREFEKASYFVASERRGDFMTFAGPLRRGFTLEEFIILDIQFSPSQERAAVVVRRSFVQSPSVTLQTERITQVWVLRDGDWYLSGPPF